MRYVIIGNGVTGITAAITLSRGRDGQVDVYAAERYPYYYRPRLHEFLAGEVAQEELYMRPEQWYADRGIQVHLDSPVARLRPAQHEVELADGREVPYDRLLLATGGVSFVPPIVGSDRAGVFVLRTLDDALAIRAYAGDCRRAVVVGCGLLGLEAAGALCKLGLEVTVLEIAPRVLPRQLDVEGAHVFAGIVERMGISVAVDASAQAILGKDRVSGVQLRDGREFPADLVIVAAGVRSNVVLAREAGLELDRGVAVDERMATSAPDVYAAGDVAVFRGQFWGIIPAATSQARVAAANMAAGEGDAPALYTGTVPSNTLNVVGVDMTSVGTVLPLEGAFEEIRCALPEQGIYRKLVLQDGVVVGAIVIGDKELARETASLVLGRAELSRDDARRLCKLA